MRKHCSRKSDGGSDPHPKLAAEPLTISRRDFLSLAGGGITLTYILSLQGIARIAAATIDGKNPSPDAALSCDVDAGQCRPPYECMNFWCNEFACRHGWDGDFVCTASFTRCSAFSCEGGDPFDPNFICTNQFIGCQSFACQATDFECRNRYTRP